MAQPASFITLPDDLIEEVFRYIVPLRTAVTVIGRGGVASVCQKGRTLALNPPLLEQRTVDSQLSNALWRCPPEYPHVWKSKMTRYSLIHPRLTPIWGEIFYGSLDIRFRDGHLVKDFIRCLGGNICRLIKHVDLHVTHDDELELVLGIKLCCQYFVNLNELKLVGRLYSYRERVKKICYTRQLRLIELATEAPGALFGGRVVMTYMERSGGQYSACWMIVPADHRLKIVSEGNGREIPAKELQEVAAYQQWRRRYLVRAYHSEMINIMTTQFTNWKRSRATSITANKHYHEFLYSYTEAMVKENSSLYHPLVLDRLAKLRLKPTAPSSRVGSYASHRSSFWEFNTLGQCWSAGYLSPAQRRSFLKGIRSTMHTNSAMTRIFRGEQRTESRLNRLEDWWTTCRGRLRGGSASRWFDPDKTFKQMVLGRDIPVRM